MTDITFVLFMLTPIYAGKKYFTSFGEISTINLVLELKNMWNDSNVNAISFSMILEIDIANIGNVAYDVILFNTIITLLAHITSKKS